MTTETTILNAFKKLVKWLVASFLVLGLLMGLIALGTYIFYEIKDRPQIEVELKGVKLGQKLGDVMFNSHGFEIQKPYTNENGSRPDADEVTYVNKKTRLDVTFKKGMVESVLYDCSQDYEYTIVSKISCGDGSEKIKQRFGEGVRVLCHMNKEVRNQLRVYDVVEYGIRYQLYYNKVVGFNIFKPEKLKELVGVNWSTCD